MSLPKRTPEEWVTVFRVNGGVKTIFAEGQSDSRILKSVISFRSDVDCRSADEIDAETPSDDFIGGNKARVMQIAEEIDRLDEQTRTRIASKVRCLIDRDFNDFIAEEFRLLGSNVLLITTFSNFLSAIVGYSFLRTVLFSSYGWDLDCKSWITLRDGLAFGFFARLRNANSTEKKSAPMIGKYFKLIGGNFRFDHAAYLQAYFGLQGNANTLIYVELASSSASVGDIKSAVNSADLFDAVYGMLKESGKAASALNVHHLRSTLLGGAVQAVRLDPTINELATWATSD